MDKSSYKFDSFCPPPFRRKAEGHRFRLSVLPSIQPSFHLSVLQSVLPSFRPPKVLCTLCAQLLLQFYADSFETLQMFCHGLKICMWFGYYPEIIFCHFFRSLNSVIFQTFLPLKLIDSGYLVCATPPTVLC